MLSWVFCHASDCHFSLQFKCYNRPWAGRMCNYSSKLFFNTPMNFTCHLHKNKYFWLSCNTCSITHVIFPSASSCAWTNCRADCTRYTTSTREKIWTVLKGIPVLKDIPVLAHPGEISASHKNKARDRGTGIWCPEVCCTFKNSHSSPNCI